MEMGKMFWVGSSASATQLLPVFLIAVSSDREALLPHCVVCKF